MGVFMCHSSHEEKQLLSLKHGQLCQHNLELLANTSTLEHKLSEEQMDGKLDQQETKDDFEVSNFWWQIVEVQQWKHFDLKLHHWGK
jgi:hypothetical protein